MKKYLIDASVLIAFFCKNDSQHEKAKTKISKLVKQSGSFFILDHVIGELEKVLYKKIGIKNTIICLDMLILNDDFKILLLDDKLLNDGFNFYKSYNEKASKKKYLCLIDIYQIMLTQRYNYKLETFDKALKNSIFL